tara:strand:+ start:349 stop:531 length:183 start_codon:yes stop_codon:yes gene_type:complete
MKKLTFLTPKGYRYKRSEALKAILPCKEVESKNINKAAMVTDQSKACERGQAGMSHELST